MAQNLQLLKRRIRTSKNIAQIAKAMEMISASKIKRGQSASLNNRPYADRITEMTANIIASMGNKKFSHPYIDKHDSDKTLLIAISPDRGLCGSLNTYILKKLFEVENKNTRIVTIGKKASQMVAKMDFEFLASYPIGSTLPSYSLVYQLKNIIDEELAANRIGNVRLLYADFVSVFTQTPIVKQLLPLDLEDEGMNSDNESSIFEPNAVTLLNDLLPYYLEIQLYNSLLQTYTSEQAARMVAMQNAKNNAFDIAEYLNLVYNKSRQERITNEILDLANSKMI